MKSKRKRPSKSKRTASSRSKQPTGQHFIDRGHTQFQGDPEHLDLKGQSIHDDGARASQSGVLMTREDASAAYSPAPFPSLLTKNEVLVAFERPDRLVEPPLTEAEVDIIVDNSARGLGAALVYCMVVCIGALVWCAWKVFGASK